jgi:hypothetical protein
MSTRDSIAYIAVKVPAMKSWIGHWHLFLDCMDEGFVFLESPEGDCLRIPAHVWEQLRKAQP